MLRHGALFASILVINALIVSACSSSGVDAPIIEILEAPPAETTDTRAAFEFECTNTPDCTFECALDSDLADQGESAGDWESCTSGHVVDDLRVGSYTLRLRATSAAGQSEASVAWRVLANPWTSVSAGYWHTCGLREDKSLWCWGGSRNGGLGLGAVTQTARPTRVGSDNDWSSVHVGSENTCAIRDDHSLWCWGLNNFGQLGVGDTENRPEPVQVASDATWSTVAMGDNFTCAVRVEGSLWCWGTAAWGKLGLGEGREQQNEPVQVGEATTWRALSLGNAHGCALRTDDTLWCWGMDEDGQLGRDQTPEERETPEDADPDRPWVPNSNVPVQVGSDADWRSVELGQHHTCAVRTDDSLWCWGSNAHGQVGIGVDTVRILAPTEVDNGAGWRSVAAAIRHSCGVRVDGTLWCWGFGEEGQLGQGENVSHNSPIQIGEGSDWLMGSPAYAHACGLREGGELWCGGIPERNGMGDGVMYLTPVQVP